MAAHLTEAEARALGFKVPATPRRRATRKAMPRVGAVSACTTCGATFDTDAEETRHVETSGHHRYDTLGDTP